MRNFDLSIQMEASLRLILPVHSSPFPNFQSCTYAFEIGVGLQEVKMCTRVFLFFFSV